MHKTINSVFNLDERTEIGKIPNPPMDSRTNLVTFMQRLPWIFLYLLHAETDPTCLWIHAQHFNINSVTRIDDFAWMLDAFGPAHFRNVNQPFDSIFKFHKSAVISNARYSSINPRTDRETFLNAGPGIREQLFISQRHTLTFAIKLEDFHLDVIADME